jgi:hypothetical protein
MGVVADKGVPPGWGRQIEQIFLMMGWVSEAVLRDTQRQRGNERGNTFGPQTTRVPRGEIDR